jgi:hypothetical protein
MENKRDGDKDTKQIKERKREIILPVNFDMSYTSCDITKF